MGVRTLSTLYVVVIVVMAVATIVEKYQGTSFVATYVYGAWWFSLLWGLLAAVGVAWLIRRRVRRPAVVALHASFVIVLVGALLTHISSERGTIHLRVGEKTINYVATDMSIRHLPFILRLDSFEVCYYPGTLAPADYVSHITVTPLTSKTAKRTSDKTTISMNNVFSHRGIRLYQSSYDDDGRGTVLSLNSDPWGIPVTYAGYALLFISFLWLLVDPKGTFRRLLFFLLLLPLGSMASPSSVTTQPSEQVRWPSQLRPLGMLARQEPSMARSTSFNGQRSMVNGQCTLPRESADRLARLNILYGDRICPVETYALDFTRKLTGSRSYGEFNAQQVLAGFIFWGDEWSRVPLIKVKGRELRKAFNLPKRAALTDFFAPDDGYILGPYVYEYYQGNHDALHKQAAQIDERLMLIINLRQGSTLKVFPPTWCSPTKIDSTVDREHRKYMQQVFTLISEDAHAGRFDRVNEFFDLLLKYQQRFGGQSLPSPIKLKAEHLYNAFPFATILFMFSLTMGLLLIILPKVSSFSRSLILSISFLTLTLCLALRWIVTGHVPMSNGYETMLLLAWLVMLLSLIVSRRLPMAVAFGFLLSGFMLLVSHISQMDPQMGQLMPVLSSPLLALHVSLIMMAFALLSMTFMFSIAALISRTSQLSPLTSYLLLYPALALLSMGIFIGAVWANESWGTYWSWDPKEVWALITLMVYAVPVHSSSLPWLRRPRAFHLYMVLAFLTVLMTYFGVNYFLGGMHSYA